jgi:hypothetical protein
MRRELGDLPSGGARGGRPARSMSAAQRKCRGRAD